MTANGPTDKTSVAEGAALLFATVKGNLPDLKELLSAGANPNFDDGDATALMYACAGGNLEAVNLLLAANASSTAGPNGTTPLMAGAAGGNLEIVKTLLAAGANPHSVGPNGNTAFFLAAHEGHHKIVKELLAAGVNPNFEDLETARSAAKQNGHDEVVVLLGATAASTCKALDKTMMESIQAAASGNPAGIKKLQQAGLINMADNELIELVRMVEVHIRMMPGDASYDAPGVKELFGLKHTARKILLKRGLKVAELPLQDEVSEPISELENANDTNPQGE